MRSSLVLPILLTLASACAAPAPVPAPRTALVVASDLDNMPFAGVDADGTPVGRDVEMMGELCRLANFELTWQRMPFDQLMPAVEEARVDAVCATLGVTKEREWRMAFTRPYFRTAIAVVVRMGEGEPSSLSDLVGRTVSGGAGTTSEKAVLEALEGAVLASADDKDRSTEERLLTGGLDGAAMDAPAADALVARHPDRLRRLPEDLAGEDYGIALPLDREAHVERLNAALRTLEESGWMAELDRRHGLSIAD